MSKQGTSFLNDTDKTIIRGTVYGLSALAVGTILFFSGRAIYRKRKSNKSESLSLNDNSTQNFAKRLKMAFDNDGWWGTDVENVRKVFVELPSKDEFEKVKKEYKNITKGGNLVKDLTDELTNTEYAEMQNILAAKAQKNGQKKIFDATAAVSSARRLKAGFDYKILGMPATDKEAVRQVLTEIPTQQAWQIVGVAYYKLYAKPLEVELMNELDVFDFSWADIIKNKPKK